MTMAALYSVWRAQLCSAPRRLRCIGCKSAVNTNYETVSVTSFSWYDDCFNSKRLSGLSNAFNEDLHFLVMKYVSRQNW